MIAVGIDPSLTSTGVAVLVDGRPYAWSRHGRDGHNGASYVSRSRRVRKLITEVTHAIQTAGQPDLIVIEEHPYAARVSGSEFDRSAVWHGIFGNCDALGYPIVVVGNKTAKVWVTGTGKAGKADIVAHVNLWYGDDLAENLSAKTKGDDDIADAFGYAAMAAFKLGDPVPFELKPRHTTGLAGLPWPAVGVREGESDDC